MRPDGAEHSLRQGTAPGIWQEKCLQTGAAPGPGPDTWPDPADDLEPELAFLRPRLAEFAALRADSRLRHGTGLACYLPGMFVRNGERGRYPALSLTGAHCAQHCAHCDGQLLQTMPDVSSPQRLYELCCRLDAQGMPGVLLTGGCDGMGQLPWQEVAPVIARIRQDTSLHVSVHCGLVSRQTAQLLARAGVQQALIDVIGSDATFREVYGLENGTRRLRATLSALTEAGLPVVPHIVAGLHFGQIVGEYEALRITAELGPEVLVLVVLMSLPGTRMAQVAPPSYEELAALFAAARKTLPEVTLSLGCARPRRSAAACEQLALLAGFNRMALPAEETCARAERMGLTCSFQPTCCSVAPCCQGSASFHHHATGEKSYDRNAPCV